MIIIDNHQKILRLFGQNNFLIEKVARRKDNPIKFNEGWEILEIGLHGIPLVNYDSGIRYYIYPPLIRYPQDYDSLDQYYYKRFLPEYWIIDIDRGEPMLHLKDIVELSEKYNVGIELFHSRSGFTGLLSHYDQGLQSALFEILPEMHFVFKGPILLHYEDHLL